MDKSLKKVFIVGGGEEYIAMFRKDGWEVVDDLPDANLVQFTGGADVTPSLYNEDTHSATSYNTPRDMREILVFEFADLYGKPMAGICRGGQFLNVMCGGSLWQDVNGHAINRNHRAYDVYSKQALNVTSTHHQMMRPGHEGIVRMVAQEATYRETKTWKGLTVDEIPGLGDTGIYRYSDKELDKMPTKDLRKLDIEAVYYPSKAVFCFQPHPEFEGEDELAKYYLNRVETMVQVKHMNSLPLK